MPTTRHIYIDINIHISIYLPPKNNQGTHREIPTVAIVELLGGHQRHHEGGEDDEGDGHHEDGGEGLVEEEEVGGEACLVYVGVGLSVCVLVEVGLGVYGKGGGVNEGAERCACCRLVRCC